MEVAVICEQMHWTYQEYEEQPEWFIKSLCIKWVADSAHIKRKNKQNGGNK